MDEIYFSYITCNPFAKMFITYNLYVYIPTSVKQVHKPMYVYLEIKLHICRNKLRL